jgi:hypothetical protein
MGEVHLAQSVAHAVFLDHALCYVRSPGQIILGAGGYVSENDFFRSPASEERCDLIEKLRFLHQETIFCRDLHGIAQSGDTAAFIGLGEAK